MRSDLSRHARVFVFSVVVLCAIPVVSDASVITFTTRSAFDAAAPGLPTETFESGLVSAAAVTTCNGGLSAASGSTCFPAAGLLSGVTYDATGNIAPNMVVIGANYLGLGNASTVIGARSMTDTLNIIFANASAVGFDFYPGFAAGDVLISVFSPTNVALGFFRIAAGKGANFFGITSDLSLIGRINVESQSTQPGELIDNLSFGIPSGPAVPEPASAWFVLTGLLLVAAGHLSRSGASRQG